MRVFQTRAAHLLREKRIDMALGASDDVPARRAGGRCLNDTGGNHMSITINIYYTGKNGNARKFAEEMERSGTAGEIRREAGNLRYDYFFPVDDPETVLLIDGWENQEAIDRHHASPMMGRITQLREKYDLHMRVERYVSDTDGIPAGDSRFIKE